MRFAREGLVFISIGIAVASVAMAFALYRRSWPLWLLAAALFVVALWIAYTHRASGPTGEPADPTLRLSRANALLGSVSRTGVLAHDDVLIRTSALPARPPS